MGVLITFLSVGAWFAYSKFVELKGEVDKKQSEISKYEKNIAEVKAREASLKKETVAKMERLMRERQEENDNKGAQPASSLFSQTPQNPPANSSSGFSANFPSFGFPSGGSTSGGSTSGGSTSAGFPARNNQPGGPNVGSGNGSGAGDMSISGLFKELNANKNKGRRGQGSAGGGTYPAQSSEHNSANALNYPSYAVNSGQSPLQPPDGLRYRVKPKIDREEGQMTDQDALSPLEQDIQR